MKKGKMKIAPARVIRTSESCPAILKRIRKTSEFFRKLSLKALKNWHQNKGAKRLVVNRLEDIGGSASWCRGEKRSRVYDFEHDPVRKVCNFSGSCSKTGSRSANPKH